MNAPWAVAVDSSGALYIADSNNFRVRKVSSAGIITTLAGNGNWPISGDGGPATTAAVRPVGVAVGADGSVYIADQVNQRIRKVSPAGTITTYAGGGASLGDGGPATSANLAFPSAIAIDALGNLYIADLNNQRIRKVLPNGIISTMAGTGVAGLSGDGGPASLAALNFPVGLAVDSFGTLFIADGANGRVRKVSPGGTISTIAGNGTFKYSGDGRVATGATLNQPVDVATDRAGNVYIADSANNRIRKLSIDGTISTFAGNGIRGFSGDGGNAVDASLNLPTGVAADSAGNIFIADKGNYRLRKVSPGGVITTIAGSGTQGGQQGQGDGGPALQAQLYSPNRVAVDGAGNIFVTDEILGRVRRISGSTGTVATFAGGGIPGGLFANFQSEGKPAIGASLGFLEAIKIDPQGNVYLADQINYRVFGCRQVESLPPSLVLARVAIPEMAAPLLPQC